MVLASSDVRSSSSPSEENSDFNSHGAVRVKRTLLSHVIKSYGSTERKKLKKSPNKVESK